MRTEFQRVVKTWGIVIIIAILAVILIPILNGKIFARPLEIIMTPIIRGASAVGSWFSRIPEPLRDRQKILTERDELQKENVKLLADIATLQAKQEEAKTIEQSQNFLTRFSLTGVNTKVIGKSFTEKHIMLIDKGATNGLQEGYAAITAEGVLVGTITRVSQESAQVLLATDATQTIGAKIQNEKASPGVVRGAFGLSYEMDLIPQDDPVAENQLVVTSAINPNIPPNILIGTVSRVEKKSGSVFQQAQVVSPVPLERVEQLTIILPPDINV